MNTLLLKNILFCLTLFLFIIFTQSCEKDEENTSSFAAFSVYPEIGLVLTKFNLRAYRITDPEDHNNILQVRWDLGY